MERTNRNRNYYDGYEHYNRMGYTQNRRNDRAMLDSFDNEYRNDRDYIRDDSRDRYREDERSRYQDNNRGYGRNMKSLRFSEYRGRDYRRGSDYENYYRRDEERYVGNHRNHRSFGDIREGYGVSSFDGTSDRFNTLNSDQRGGNIQEDQPYYSGRRDGFRSSRFGGDVGDASTHSDRGIPNYGIRTFADDYGSGVGSSYGGKNYGAGTGYASGNRGGVYGNSSGNYGGYGSIGGSTYGGGRGATGGDTSHNSDRSTTSLGGF